MHINCGVFVGGGGGSGGDKDGSDERGKNRKRKKKRGELIITASFEIRIWPRRSARCNVVVVIVVVVVFVVVIVIVFRDPCIFRGPDSSTASFFYAGHGN